MKYEDDRDLKIPGWYLKLPQKVLNIISDSGIAFSHIVHKKKKSRNKCNVKFYI